jgi:hypothetical protein
VWRVRRNCRTSLFGGEVLMNVQSRFQSWFGTMVTFTCQSTQMKDHQNRGVVINECFLHFCKGCAGQQPCCMQRNGFGFVSSLSSVSQTVVSMEHRSRRSIMVPTAVESSFKPHSGQRRQYTIHHFLQGVILIYPQSFPSQLRP